MLRKYTEAAIKSYWSNPNALNQALIRAAVIAGDAESVHLILSTIRLTSNPAVGFDRLFGYKEIIFCLATANVNNLSDIIEAILLYKDRFSKRLQKEINQLIQEERALNQRVALDKREDAKTPLLRGADRISEQQNSIWSELLFYARKNKRGTVEANIHAYVYPFSQPTLGNQDKESLKEEFKSACHSRDLGKLKMILEHSHITDDFRQELMQLAQEQEDLFSSMPTNIGEFQKKGRWEQNPLCREFDHYMNNTVEIMFLLLRNGMKLSEYPCVIHKNLITAINVRYAGISQFNLEDAVISSIATTPQIIKILLPNIADNLTLFKKIYAIIKRDKSKLQDLMAVTDNGRDLLQHAILKKDLQLIRWMASAESPFSTMFIEEDTGESDLVTANSYTATAHEILADLKVSLSQLRKYFKNYKNDSCAKVYAGLEYFGDCSDPENLIKFFFRDYELTFENETEEKGGCIFAKFLEIFASALVPAIQEKFSEYCSFFQADLHLLSDSSIICEALASHPNQEFFLKVQARLHRKALTIFKRFIEDTNQLLRESAKHECEKIAAEKLEVGDATHETVVNIDWRRPDNTMSPKSAPEEVASTDPEFEALQARIALLKAQGNWPPKPTTKKKSGPKTSAGQVQDLPRAKDPSSRGTCDEAISATPTTKAILADRKQSPQRRKPKIASLPPVITALPTPVPAVVSEVTGENLATPKVVPETVANSQTVAPISRIARPAESSLAQPNKTEAVVLPTSRNESSVAQETLSTKPLIITDDKPSVVGVTYPVESFECSEQSEAENEYDSETDEIVEHPQSSRRTRGWSSADEKKHRTELEKSIQEQLRLFEIHYRNLKDLPLKKEFQRKIRDLLQYTNLQMQNFSIGADAKLDVLEKALDKLIIFNSKIKIPLKEQETPKGKLYFELKNLQTALLHTKLKFEKSNAGLSRYEKLQFDGFNNWLESQIKLVQGQRYCFEGEIGFLNWINATAKEAINKQTTEPRLPEILRQCRSFLCQLENAGSADWQTNDYEATDDAQKPSWISRILRTGTAQKIRAAFAELHKTFTDGCRSIQSPTSYEFLGKQLPVGSRASVDNTDPANATAYSKPYSSAVKSISKEIASVAAVKPSRHR